MASLLMRHMVVVTTMVLMVKHNKCICRQSTIQ
eukprot:COSAG01_NODE_4262_length_5199_cov_16.571569_3_plen_33_part_00